MNRCLAQLDLYRQQPDEALLGQSHRVIDYLTKDDGLMITGTCSLAERFRNNQETRGDVGESCATAYLIRMTHYLLQLEGNTLDGDIMERAIYNALFAAQSPDGRSLRYFTGHRRSAQILSRRIPTAAPATGGESWPNCRK